MDRASVWPKLNYSAKWAAVVLLAAALKLYYSSAGVDDLRWILAPTACLVELTTGLGFYFEAHVGYMSIDRTFLIALPCSGVNFLIVAFLTLSLRRLLGDNVTWRSLGFAVVIAFVATIVANTARISVAIQLRDLAPALDWLEPEDLHRLEGIAVYFAALLVLYFVDERADQRSRSRYTDRTSNPLWRYLLPLGVYYAVTLGIPIANGAYKQGSEFWRHSLFVVFAPMALMATAQILRSILIRKSPANAGGRSIL
jgi:exosortase K